MREKPFVYKVYTAFQRFRRGIDLGAYLGANWANFGQIRDLMPSLEIEQVFDFGP